MTITGEDLISEPSSSPLSAKAITEVDDVNSSQAGNGGGATSTALTIVLQPMWPVEIELVYVTGMNKVKLLLQSCLLQGVFHMTFDNV